MNIYLDLSQFGSFKVVTPGTRICFWGEFAIRDGLRNPAAVSRLEPYGLLAWDQGAGGLLLSLQSNLHFHCAFSSFLYFPYSVRPAYLLRNTLLFLYTQHSSCAMKPFRQLQWLARFFVVLSWVIWFSCLFSYCFYVVSSFSFLVRAFVPHNIERIQFSDRNWLCKQF